MIYLKKQSEGLELCGTILTKRYNMKILKNNCKCRKWFNNMQIFCACHLLKWMFYSLAAAHFPELEWHTGQMSRLYGSFFKLLRCLEERTFNTGYCLVNIVLLRLSITCRLTQPQSTNRRQLSLKEGFVHYVFSLCAFFLYHLDACDHHLGLGYSRAWNYFPCGLNSARMN